MESAQPIRMSQDSARSFILEYQSVIEKKGATQIAKDILRHTGKHLEQKTLYNWMRGVTSSLSANHFNAVLLFINTGYFKSILVHPTALFMHQERIKKIGSALFDIYGNPEIGTKHVTKAHAAIKGWWKSWIPFHDGSKDLNYLYIDNVPDCPFSTFVTSVRTERGDGRALGDVAGLLFYDNKYVFSARGWSYDSWKKIDDVSFFLIDDPNGYIEIEWIPEIYRPTIRWAQRFNRANESEIDNDTKNFFDYLKAGVIPRSIGHKRELSPELKE